MMQAWEIGPKNGIGGLRLVERAALMPGPGEVLVDVVAAGLNYRDLMVLGGNYGNNVPETRVPTADGTGRIVALASG